MRDVQRAHGRLLRQLRRVRGVVGFGHGARTAGLGFGVGTAGLGCARGALDPRHSLGGAGREHAPGPGFGTPGGEST
ncbi:hypothetical protein, partial [Streptomyces sp.]|uniref:hypothetical protein n=1 Tax=Streptomyces sp. TaxID=1931 RepID=UPI002D777927